MKSQLILLLNLAVLVVNFFLAWGSSESQQRVLRATARASFQAPIPPRFARVPLRADSGPFGGPPGSANATASGRVGGVPRARLVKYLYKLSALERLSARQVEALLRGLAYSCREFSSASDRLGEARFDGAGARAIIGQAHHRIRNELESSLRGAALDDSELLGQLVRIVLSSAG